MNMPASESPPGVVTTGRAAQNPVEGRILMPQTLPDPAHGTVEDRVATLEAQMHALFAEIRKAIASGEPSRPVRHLSVVREQS